MIKAICFDLDGVYFTETGKKAFHKKLVDIVGDEGKVVHVLYKSDEMRSFVTGKITEQEFFDFVREYLSIDSSNQEISDLWVEEYEIDSKVRESVLKARENGYITCICSNNNPARVNALEKKFRFLTDFDVVVFSYEVGFFKPTKEIFQTLIDKSGVKANEIVYSDDNPERLDGAKELGINTFVYGDFDSFIQEIRDLGVEI